MEYLIFCLLSFIILLAGLFWPHQTDDEEIECTFFKSPFQDLKSLKISLPPDKLPNIGDNILVTLDGVEVLETVIDIRKQYTKSGYSLRIYLNPIRELQTKQPI